MRFTRLAPLLFSAVLLLPVSASALEGIGPRASVTGTVQEVHITDKQKFDELGGELIIKASNGQIVTVVLQDKVVIMSEGRMSRKQLLPENIVPGMLVRIRGWRVDSKTLTASLIVIVNIELNPVLNMNGVIQSIDGDKVTVLNQDGVIRTFTITNETTINITYELTGAKALNLIGKQALLTLNPDDTTLVRIMRITGDVALQRTGKAPSTIDTQRTNN